MDKLGKFLRSVRLRKNISEMKAARRAELPLEEYVRYEYSPAKAPLDKLSRMFEAIEMAEEEYAVFTGLCVAFYQSTPRPLEELVHTPRARRMNIFGNVIPLQDRRGIRKTAAKGRKSQEPKKIPPENDQV
jgi:hypothetical protein